MIATATVLVAIGIGAAVLGALGARPHEHLRFLPGWLALSIFGFFVMTVVLGELWRRLVAALGSQLEPRRSLAIWCLSMLARYAPTSMLMPVVRVSMSRARAVPGGVCAASMVYETVLAIGGAVWVSSYVIIALPALHHAAWRWGVLVLPLLFMLTLHPTGMRLLSSALLRRLKQEPLPIQLSFKRMFAFLAGYAASSLIAGVSLLALVIACHPLALADAPVVAGAMAVGGLASIVGFILPGGLGAREAALVAVLTLVMPLFVATTVAVASRLIQIAIELLLGFVMPWLARRHEFRRAAGATRW
jgi:hypothetical protein